MRPTFAQLQSLALIAVLIAIAVYDLFAGHELGKDADLVIILGSASAGGIHIAYSAGASSTAAGADLGQLQAAMGDLSSELSQHIDSVHAPRPAMPAPPPLPQPPAPPPPAG